jgi:hypothetical protein
MEKEKATLSFSKVVRASKHLTPVEFDILVMLHFESRIDAKLITSFGSGVSLHKPITSVERDILMMLGYHARQNKLSVK